MHIILFILMNFSRRQSKKTEHWQLNFLTHFTWPRTGPCGGSYGWPGSGSWLLAADSRLLAAGRAGSRLMTGVAAAVAAVAAASLA